MELTHDAVARGWLQLWQPRRGYRFNTDSVLLAAMAAHVARDAGADALAVDAGAGCGIGGLWVARAVGCRVLMVERQHVMAGLCLRNAVENGATRAAVVEADFRALPVADGSVDVLLCNPPYRPVGTGLMSPDPQRRASNHMLHGGVVDVLREALRVLSPRGACVVVGPIQDVLAAPTPLHRSRVLRFGAEAHAPTRALVVFTRTAGKARDETRAVHVAGGAFAPWVDDILEGRTTALP